MLFRLKLYQPHIFRQYWSVGHFCIVGIPTPLVPHIKTMSQSKQIYTNIL